MTELQQHAHAYKKLGWNLVPLFNYSKNPYPFKWKKYETEKMTNEEFESWINNPELTGVGVVTGEISNLTVIDEDSYKEGGMRFKLDSTMVDETANGGHHYYFQYNPEISTAGLKQGVFVEIKSAGGFVVLPPSGAYKKDGETIGVYSWIKKPSKISDIPKINIDAVADFTQPKQLISTDQLLEVDYGQQHTSMRTLMLKLLVGSEEQSWENIIRNQVFTAAKNYNPPFDEWKLERLWEDCKRFAKQKKIEKSLPKRISLVAKDRIDGRRLEKLSPSTGFSKLDAHIRGFVPGHLYTVTGHTNVGKTSIASNFACRVASQGKKVLYFSLEPDDNIVEYLVSVKLKKPFSQITDEDIKNNLPNIDIYTKEQVSEINQLVLVIRSLPRYDLIIIDHLGYFTRGEKISVNQEQSNVVKQLVSLAKEKQCAIMQIVHVNKATENTPTMKNISGSAAIYQDSTDVLIVVRSVDESSTDLVKKYLDSGYILVEKSKSGPNGCVPISFQPSSAYMTDGTPENNNYEDEVYKLLT
jgi:archaellum biogenesis ATPase FlaH